METRFDYERLRERKRRLKIKGSTMATAMGITPATLSTKLTHGLPFSQPEILGACGVLGIPVAKLHQYFFCTRVSKIGK